MWFFGLVVGDAVAGDAVVGDAVVGDAVIGAVVVTAVNMLHFGPRYPDWHLRHSQLSPTAGHHASPGMQLDVARSCSMHDRHCLAPKSQTMLGHSVQSKPVTQPSSSQLRR